MYKWNNEKKVESLSAQGEDNVLLFETPSEKARVYIHNGDIEKVVFNIQGGEESTITKQQSTHVLVGEKNWERDVWHYLAPGGPAPTMRLGITKHKGYGTWSSLPHDFELHTEPGFEEVFFYMLEGSPKRAIQVGKGVWHDNTAVDGIWRIEDNTFGTVPMGYHPVVAEPHVNVSYIWVYLAKKKEWEKI
jgi:5-deoxy-D-glucuronate isomerase